MKPIRTLLLLTCTLAAIQNAAAIYEDQAGTYDWYRAHLGHVHNLYISRKQHVFAASQDATVARLSINDGSIVWRRVQDAPGTPASLIDLIMLPKEDGFVTVHNSDDATMLRVWRAGNGQLMWEAPLHMEGLGAPGLSAAAVGVDDTKGTVVVLGLAAGQIKAHALSGKVLWQQDLPSFSPSHQECVMASNNSLAFVLCGVPGDKSLQLYRLQLADGAVDGGPVTLTLPTTIATHTSSGNKITETKTKTETTAAAASWQFAGGCFVGVGVDGSLCTVDPQGSTTPTCTTPTPTPPLGRLLTVHPVGALGVGLVFEHGASVARVSHGKPSITVGVEGAQVVGGLEGADGTPLAVFAGTTPSSSPTTPPQLHVHMYQALQGTHLHTHTLPATPYTYSDGTPLPLVTVAATAAGSMTSNQLVIAAVLSFVDGTMVALEVRPTKTRPQKTVQTQPAKTGDVGDVGGQHDTGKYGGDAEVMWVRDDGLAYAEKVLFSDLPPASGESHVVGGGGGDGADGGGTTSSGGVWEALGGDRVRLQWLTLKTQLQIATPEDVAMREQLKQSTNDVRLPYRDTIGFRRMLLIPTPHGSVYALHSGDGHTIWRWRGIAGCSINQLLPWHTAHSLSHTPRWLAIVRCAIDTKGVVLDGYTGRAVEWVSVMPDTRRVLPLRRRIAREVGVEQHAYALLSGSGEDTSVMVLPKLSPEQRTPLLQDVYFYEPTPDARGLVGYMINPTTLRAQEVWRVQLATTPGMRVLTVVGPDAADAIHSSSKVLGDRTLKFKFISPNLVFAAVGPAADTGADDSSTAGASSITVWVLDATTGRVLVSHTHKGAHGPVHAVFCEHWVAYHYVRIQGHRYQVSVMELYDAVAHNTTIKDVLLGTSMLGRNESGLHSSSEYTPIETLHRSFVTTHLPSVSAIGVTRTLQGIAQKTLLLGTTTGQVYAMDRKLIDPRRPERPNNKPTAEDMEEGLVPYMPQLPYRPTGYLTTNHHVSSLRGMVSAATQLESTALVASYGRDLHCTRALPSGSFDQLQSNFPYALLVMITSGLLVAVVVVRRLAADGSIKDKWM